MAVLLVGALVASVYVIYMLEILKLRRFRLRQRSESAPGAEREVDEGVKRELDTGEYAAVNPESGELAAVDPKSGEMEPVKRTFPDP